MTGSATLMEFLDTVRNHDDVPNENYARELQELFTLGVKDFGSPPQNNYTQADIVQIARAFTGWDYDDHGISSMNDGDHDYEADFPGRGPKVIYKTTGGFGASGRDYADQGRGPRRSTGSSTSSSIPDSTGKNTSRVGRIGCAVPPHPSPALTTFVDQVVADADFDNTWNIGSGAPILCPTTSI